jgi:hypothetical protein
VKTKKKAAKKPAKAKTTRKGGAKLWTSAEVKHLRTMYKTHSTTVIAKQLKRTVSSVRSKAVALSLRKGPAKKAAAKKGGRR